MAIFDISSIANKKPTEEKKNGKAYVHKITASSREFLIGKSLKDMESQIGTLQPNTVYHYATGGQWSAHELLAYALNQTGPATVYISTWTISEDPLRVILSLIDQGLITELHCLFSDRILKDKIEPLQLARGLAQRMAFTKVHAKSIAVLNEENGIAIVGSGNLSRNPRIESGTIDTHRSAAEFHANWISNEIDNLKPFSNK